MKPRHRSGKHEFLKTPRGAQIVRARIVRVFLLRRQCDEPVLPDDAIGQSGLRILLALGLTGPEALKLAPWCASDLHLIIEDVLREPPRLDKNSIGNAIELTFEERTKAKAWNIAAFDKSPDELDELRRWRERVKKRQQRERKRKRTQRLAANGDLSLREESLFVAIDDQWRSLAKLATEICGGTAWRRPDGQPLAGSALRMASKRAADTLKKEGHIEDKTEPGLYGESNRLVRLGRNGARLGDTFCDGDPASTSCHAVTPECPPDGRNPEKWAFPPSPRYVPQTGKKLVPR